MGWSLQSNIKIVHFNDFPLGNYNIIKYKMNNKQALRKAVIELINRGSVTIELGTPASKGLVEAWNLNQLGDLLPIINPLVDAGYVIVEKKTKQGNALVNIFTEG